MFRETIIGVIITYAIIIFSVHVSSTQKDRDYRVLFYNCENLFDTINDPFRDDDEFCRGGVRGWSDYRLFRKLNAVFKVFVASGEWSPPEIIGLCEVESRQVLIDLLSKTPLSKYNYQIVHNESPDRRGIDVALLYNADIFNLGCEAFFNPFTVNQDSVKSREILYANLLHDDIGIHLFVCHFPSNRGGVGATSMLREEVANCLKLKIDSVGNSVRGDQMVLVMGDLNCEAGDRELAMFVEENSNSNEPYLVMPSFKEGVAEGSYKYQGSWYTYDNFIVRDCSLNDKCFRYIESSCFIIDYSFLLERDESYPGMRPFPTYRGFMYKGGFSDHLPIVLDLEIVPN